MYVKVIVSDHPEVLEVLASQHCVARFRKRRGVRTPGIEAVERELRAALQAADFTRWRPGWVDSDTHTEMWALVEDLAFPLSSTPTQGRWIASTCLVKRTRR